jgi:ABC-type proline/glycine betaine transport system permease subunit
MNRFQALSTREKLLIAFVLIAILSRLIPHLPNFTAVTATALFAGRYFKNKILAFAAPLTVMILSDLILGFYTISWFVFASFAAVVFLGQWSQKMNVLIVLFSSLTFFVISNFGVWLLGYPLTLEGFIACYTAAIPFFRNAILGDLFYAAILYYSFKWVERRYLLEVQS